MDDPFKKLLAFQWRGIGFPCASFDVEVTQDHVDHKWPDRDGAHIEGTGRNPLVFSARAVFRNGVSRGSNESFRSGQLYPGVYRDFLEACADRSTGFLQHPELGVLQVKCKSAKTHWDANKRDGVDVDVIWIETVDRFKLDEVLARPSPAAECNANASTLDAEIAVYINRPASSPAVIAALVTISRPIPGLPSMSFSQLMNGITGVFDSVTLATRQVAGKINEVAYRLDVLSTAIDRAKDVQSWPIRQAIENLRSSLHDAKTRILVDVHPISVYIVPRAATLSAIAAYLGAPISDILKLNALSYASPVIPRGTAIRYYTSLKDQRR